MEKHKVIVLLLLLSTGKMYKCLIKIYHLVTHVSLQLEAYLYNLPRAPVQAYFNL